MAHPLKRVIKMRMTAKRDGVDRHIQHLLCQRQEALFVRSNDDLVFMNLHGNSRTLFRNDIDCVTVKIRNLQMDIHFTTSVFQAYSLRHTVSPAPL